MLATIKVASKANKRLDISSSSNRIKIVSRNRVGFLQQTKLSLSAPPPLIGSFFTIDREKLNSPFTDLIKKS